MTITALAFGIMGLVSVVFVAATSAQELNLNLEKWTQSGDTSLSKHSINWLAAVAITAAVYICFGLL